MGEKCKSLMNKVRKHSAHETNQAKKQKKKQKKKRALFYQRLLCTLNNAFNICDITPLALRGLLMR